MNAIQQPRPFPPPQGFQPYAWPAPPPAPPPRSRSGWQRVLFGAGSQSMALSAILIAGAFLIAGVVVVVKIIIPPPMMFQAAKKMPALPARKLEHRIRVKQFEQQARRPKIVNKLVSTSAAKIVLPQMPLQLQPAKTDFRALAAPLTPAGAHLGQLGLGGMGIGKGGIGAFQGFSEAQFFGHQIKTRAIVILCDTTSSIVKKGIFEELRRETISMVEQFHVDTVFNVILFTDGALPFSPDLVFATHAVKTNLTQWMQRRMKQNVGQASGSGSTPIVALKAALEMKPDTIVLITEDPPWRGVYGVDSVMEKRQAHIEEILDVVRAHQQSADQRVTINTVAYKPYKSAYGDQGRKFLKDLASMSGGRYREVVADEKDASASPAAD